MKKILLRAAAILGLALAGALALTEPVWSATPERCDPKNVYCAGLVAAYKFEEGTDYIRKDALSGAPVFMECDGSSIANTPGKNGYGLLSTTTSKGLGARFGGAAFGAGPWTMVFWVYPTTNGTTPLVTTHDQVNKKGVIVDLWWDASVLKPRFRAYENETQTLRTATITTSTSLSAWHMIAVSVSRYLTGTARICISRDGAAPTCTTITQNVRASNLDLLIAGGDTSDYDRGAASGTCAAGGKVPGNTTIDEMLVYARALTNDELSGLYAAGSGRFFPGF